MAFKCTFIAYPTEKINVFRNVVSANEKDLTNRNLGVHHAQSCLKTYFVTSDNRPKEVWQQQKEP